MTALINRMVVVILEEILNDMRTDKSALFIKRNRQ